MAYTAVKFVHILLAITAVGFNGSYAVWLQRSDGRSREVTEFALRGIKFMDDRIANPAYGLLLVTGLTMVFLGPWKLTTRWIDAALGVYVILVVMAVFYTRSLRNQIQALEAEGADSEAYRTAGARQRALGIAFAPVLLVILALMVFQPGS